MRLDFSKLDKLAYRNFDTPEARQTKDDLIEQGFTIVEDKDNPFTGPEAAQRPPEPPQETRPTHTPPSATRPSKGQSKPFKSVTGLDYRAFYGDLYRWHERYTAQVLQNANAWTAANNAWAQLCERYNAEANPYVQQVLVSVHEELEREYNAAQQQGLAYT